MITLSRFGGLRMNMVIIIVSKTWVNLTRMQSGEGYVPRTHLLCTLSGFHDRTIYSVHWSRFFFCFVTVRLGGTL
ncbi:protein CIA1-like [Arabidopsis lyrata subsp. lyrata]|uniref:protein CIA1-like n=1 Tax=Arabidopsis lyrata subsp. lyrata TaxID=81972 RepID=UPI000A29C840|nr:protein CIA1-like [Arabidopsis lyrata subsp. lyrata]|eukprot:XP_020870515.1 protein CIA1-like [Arabidopsis lyrata subsp. lyrata]